MYCHVEDCMSLDAKLRCSECHSTYYCSQKCQKKDWAQHKKSCAMQKMLNQFNEEQAKKPKPKPRKTHCTGCNVKFDDENYYVDQECPDCGYMTCESCSCSNDKGTCDCKDSNFGHRYCSRFPQYYHRYSGDYHPDMEEFEMHGLAPEQAEQLLEATARKCGNCGETERCMKPGAARAMY